MFTKKRFKQFVIFVNEHIDREIKFNEHSTTNPDINIFFCDELTFCLFENKKVRYAYFYSKSLNRCIQNFDYFEDIIKPEVAIKYSSKPVRYATNIDIYTMIWAEDMLKFSNINIFKDCKTIEEKVFQLRKTQQLLLETIPNTIKV